MRRAIGVFARAPVAGEVKTRLIERLGAGGAARLHEQLTTLALQRAAMVPGTSVFLWVSGPTDHPFVVKCVQDSAVQLESQCGADLGQRMAHAFDRMLSQSDRAVVIGTDCPAQDARALTTAFEALSTADAVLQPAEDGGYVLIGVRRPQPTLFEGIHWGSDQVLAQTRARARAAGITVAELPLCWDLDRPADYERAVALGLVDAP